MWVISCVVLIVTTVHLNDAFLSPALNKTQFNQKYGINSDESKVLRYAYFTQWRDHFNTNDFSTFDQKIYINDAHYNLGPVFIFVGSELAEYEYWLQNSFASHISREQFGVVYGIEPRFYGENRPTDDLSIENLQLLTVDQTLADLVGFVQFLQLELSNKKFILFGFGDGAAYATLAHQTYPDLFDGVWAVGAPTYVRFDFFDFLPEFQDTLINFDSPCYSIISSGLTELDTLFEDGDIERIHELFGFQNRINLNIPNEVSLVFHTVLSELAKHLEYGTQKDLTNLCTSLQLSVAQGLSAVELIARIISPFTQNANPNWDENVASLSETSWNAPAVVNGQRQFWYIACTLRGFFRSSTYYPEPITLRFPIRVFLDLCFEVFGLTSEEVLISHTKSNAKYRLDENLPNVIFTNGELDPSRIVSQITNLNPTSPAEVIPGFGKIFELLGDLPADYLTSEMVAARAHVRSHIMSIIQN